MNVLVWPIPQWGNEGTAGPSCHGVADKTEGERWEGTEPGRGRTERRCLDGNEVLKPEEDRWEMRVQPVTTSPWWCPGEKVEVDGSVPKVAGQSAFICSDLIYPRKAVKRLGRR